MEIVGGFMVMMSIIGLFLAVIWLIMPFVVFAIKGKQDRTLEVLEAIERRLEVLESRFRPIEAVLNHAGSAGSSASPNESSSEHPIENEVILTESASGKNCQEVTPEVLKTGGF